MNLAKFDGVTLAKEQVTALINDSIAISAKADFRVLKLQKGDSIKYLKQDIEYGLPVERFEIITLQGKKPDNRKYHCPVIK